MSTEALSLYDFKETDPCNKVLTSHAFQASIVLKSIV